MYQAPRSSTRTRMFDVSSALSFRRVELRNNGRSKKQSTNFSWRMLRFTKYTSRERLDFYKRSFMLYVLRKVSFVKLLREKESFG